MITWLTDNIGTGPYLDIDNANGEYDIIDVRNLVDKSGNKSAEILAIVDLGVDLIRKNKKIVIACDYGMSRSNSIAIGVIAKSKSFSFHEALNLVKDKIRLDHIKPEVLDAVYKVINPQVKVKSEGPRLVITGSSGFLGKALESRLKEKFFVKTVSSKDFDLISGSVYLDFIVKENGIDTIVHLANPRVYTLNKAMGDSLVMLKNVIDVCNLNKIKLLFVSSWEIYSGYEIKELIVNEETPALPKGSYGETKWLSEQLIVHHHNVSNLDYTIFRASPIYGEGSDKPKFIYNFLDRAKRNQTIVTHEYLNGAPNLDLLYVHDFTKAVENCMKVDARGVFNIASGTVLSTKEIAKLVVSTIKSGSKIESTLIDSYYPDIRFDTSKATNELSWSPEVTFKKFINSLAKLS